LKVAAGPVRAATIIIQGYSTKSVRNTYKYVPAYNANACNFSGSNDEFPGENT
jgi:hypothetical protein